VTGGRAWRPLPFGRNNPALVVLDCLACSILEPPKRERANRPALPLTQGRGAFPEHSRNMRNNPAPVGFMGRRARAPSLP
jgi:hypothetical protein